jgi:SNF2 family DNA or RNA helicase
VTLLAGGAQKPGGQWQREAERFTPHLRFLEYLGTGRNRENPLLTNTMWC